MTNIRERYIVNQDPHHHILNEYGTTFGLRLVHRGVWIEARGCRSEDEAIAIVMGEVNRRAWRLREKWWQFWRPKDPRAQA